MKRTGFAWLAGFVLATFVASAALAAAPMWMPGFPLRAGAAVIIMWTPVPGAAEYKLLKKMGTGDFKEVYKGPVNTYNDADAPASKTIEYKVLAVVGGKDGDLSVPAVLKGVEPIKPPVFTGAIPTADSITVRWSNPPGSMFFNLYRAEKKDGPYDLLGSFQQETYTDRKLAKGKPYFYRVTAIDRNNTESEKSDVLESKLAEVAVNVVSKEELRKPVPKGTFTGEDLYEFNQPFDVARTKNGEIAVLDRTSIQISDKDGKYLRRINFDAKWGLSGGVIADSDGHFVVSFFSENVVRKIDQDSGKMIWEIRYPPVPGKANRPVFTAIDKEGNYWIADANRYQAIKMNKDGKVLDNVGRLAGTYNADNLTDNDLPGITKIYFNPYDGNIYCTIGLRAEIRVFNPKTGKGVKTFGGLGNTPSTFQGVGGIGFKKNGNILVYDSMLNLIKEFDKEYKYVATYADIQDKGGKKMSANLGSAFLYDEAANRVFITANLSNKGYIYDMPQ
jgi:outer membrane protein assembly factor BamB